MTLEHPLRNGQALLIRPGAPADAAAILGFLEAVCVETDYLSFGPGEFEMTLEEEQAYLERSVKVDNRLYLVATVESTIVATLSYEGGRRPRTCHTGELGISVLKTHWGLGVGTFMMQALIEWARAGASTRKLNLRVRVDNAKAIRLYERMGFEVEGTVRRDLCVDGTFHDHLFMGLTIG